MKYTWSIESLLMAALLLVAGCSKQSAAQTEPSRDALAGRKLSDKQVSELESTLERNPDDLSARTKLLGYYFQDSWISPQASASKRKHVLWIIKNRPEAKIAGLPYCSIYPDQDKEGFEAAKKLWVDQTKAHANNAKVLGNAAQFLFLHARGESEGLLKQAQKLEPGNPEWSSQLAMLYSLQSGNEAAANSLAEYEKAQEARLSENEKFYGLTDLAKSAYKAGDMKKAAQYANELLKTSKKYPNDWNYGNAIHHGNNVLGMISLNGGDSKQAGEYLLKAGETPGSPQLNSFGPNMSLAKALLEKGEKETVLQYFERCQKFWRMGGERLDQWTREVKGGKVPAFGGNLRY